MKLLRNELSAYDSFGRLLAGIADEVLTEQKVWLINNFTVGRLQITIATVSYLHCWNLEENF